MTKTLPAYHLKDIRHYYGETKVLDIDDLKIEQGSITGLIGPNGSGKSTLLKLLAFAQKPTFGSILYKGRHELPFSPTVRSKVTLLTQKPYLLKRTVFENIAYGLKIRNDKNLITERVEKALLNVGLDYQKFAPRKWHELSGGEAQRVAMAARLILKPEVLLLDEPIASVDTKSAKLIREASLKARHKWGTTLVIASHDLQWLYSISDHQLSIFNGNIFSTGMENIITGPFHNSDRESNGKTVIKQLGDGQTIRLRAPLDPDRSTGMSPDTPTGTPTDTPTDTSMAIIRKKSITVDLEKQAEKSRLNQLSGHIVSMLLENKSGHIMATISVHDLSFVLRLIPDQISAMDLYPGKKVILKFQADDVEWI